MKLVWDIETDGLEATLIWCLCAIDLDTGTEYRFSDYDDDLLGSREAIGLLKSTDVHVGHNLIGYDIPTVERIWGIDLSEAKVYDTWVMSQTLRYKRTHKHGLGGWGEALNNSKISFDDWAKYSKEMLRYCMQDVRLNRDVYNQLIEEFAQAYKFNPKIREGLRIEHDTAHFNAYVKQRGWKFDEAKAKETRKKFKARMSEIEMEIEPRLGDTISYIDKAPKTPKFKKDGTYNAITCRILSEYFGHEVQPGDTHLMPPGTEFQRSKVVPISLGQMDLVKEWLLKDMGWKPDDYTVKKIDGKWVRQSPKFTQTSLSKLGKTGEMISEYYTLRNRLAVLDGWLDNTVEGRLHGNMWTIGTPTFRVRHEGIVNLPGVETPYGKELRELLVADEGMVVVGADSSGNQLRALAHYVNNDSFTNEIINGDQHARNAEILGCSRPVAKSYLYAYIFGAGLAKLGSVLSGKPNAELGKTSSEKFGRGIKGLGDLKEKIQGQWKQTTFRQGIGWFPALDGRPVFSDSGHQCLNYLLQSAEAITCKAALSYAWRKIKDENLEAEPRLFYHDELAFVASVADSKRVGEILQEAFREAPKEFGVDIMDGGDYVIGTSYADVH